MWMLMCCVVWVAIPVTRQFNNGEQLCYACDRDVVMSQYNVANDSVYCRLPEDSLTKVCTGFGYCGIVARWNPTRYTDNQGMSMLRICGNDPLWKKAEESPPLAVLKAVQDAYFSNYSRTQVYNCWRSLDATQTPPEVLYICFCLAPQCNLVTFSRMLRLVTRTVKVYSDYKGSMYLPVDMDQPVDSGVGFVTVYPPSLYGPKPGYGYFETIELDMSIFNNSNAYISYQPEGNNSSSNASATAGTPSGGGADVGMIVGIVVGVVVVSAIVAGVVVWQIRKRRRARRAIRRASRAARRSVDKNTRL